MNFPFLREEKFGLREQLTFVGHKMEIYIPSYFLEKTEGIAKVLGNKIESIGLFWFKADGQWYELQLPIKLMFEFTEETKKKLRIQPGMPSMDYVVYTLTTNDAFVYDTNHKQNSDDLNWFISKMIEGAKLPPTVAYPEVFNLFSRALNITKINDKLGVPFLTIEFILSELFRSKRNLSNPFRLNYDKNRPYDYKMVRITKVPEMNSTFTGMIGEDIKQQLVSAVLKNRQGKSERQSPIEKVLKY